MVTLAIAGAGWASAIHGLAADGVDDLRVARVASRRPGATARRARQLDAVPCTYSDLPGGAEAVVVATPPHLHLRETERAVAAGAAVLVEAPLADTLAGADRIEKLAADGLVAYGENLVYAPAVIDAVRACRAIGPLKHLEVRIAQGRPPRRAHLKPDWGGGALFDPGAHAVALALLLAAPARAVAAEAKLSAGQGAEVDDNANLTLAFDTGLRAQVQVTWRRSAPSWHAQASSAGAAVRLELTPSATLEVNGTPISLPPVPPLLTSPQLHELGYVGQLAALASTAATRHPPRSGPGFGRRVLEVICAGYAAARAGRPEPLPFSGPRDRTPLALWRPDESHGSA